MYSLQDILKGSENIVFNPDEAKHVDYKKVWLTAIDLYMIAMFVKEVNSSEELLINLTESDIDMFISDLETTNIGRMRVTGASIPFAMLTAKPSREDSVLGRLSQYGITFIGANVYTCFSRGGDPYIDMFVRASEAKRIIYQMLTTGSFTNEGIVYVAKTSSTRITKPSQHEFSYYWSIAENQNIPIITKDNIDQLYREKSTFRLEIEGARVCTIPKNIIEEIKQRFINGIFVNYGSHSRGLLRTINPSLPLDKQGKEVVTGVGEGFVPLSEFDL